MAEIDELELARRFLRRVVSGGDLSRDETEQLFGRLMDGDLTEELKAGLLIALATKGETVDEITGAVRAMRRRVLAVSSTVEGLVDTCGTGGDGAGTFNISTAAALIAAAAGVPIAKHGNRSVSSRSGSADVLEALGVDLSVDRRRSARLLEEVGIAFLFAPSLHPAMRQVASVRRELGIRTLFNILGPLTNPARARRQVLGVYDENLVERVARVLVELGCDHALVVRGRDGLDELTTTGPTVVAEVRGKSVRTYEVEPEQLGLRRAAPGELSGGDPEDNARHLRRILEGGSGARAEITVLNAGAAIYVGGRSETLVEGVAQAREVQASGKGADLLARLCELPRGGAEA